MTPDQKIKVCHFIWSLDIGGIREVVLNLVKAQLNNPLITSCLLVGKTAKTFNTNLLTDIPHFECRLRSGFDLSMKKFFFIRSAMKHADLIHIHTFNPLVALAAVCSRKKIVYTIHGNFSFFRKKSFSEKLNSMLLKAFINRVPDIVTYNSDFTGEVAVRRFGLIKTRHQKIYNGIPLNLIEISMEKAREQLQLPQDAFIIGMVCRFVEFKKLDRLIRAFADFQHGKKTLLVLVGDGPLRTALEDQARESGVKDKVIFTGYKNNPGLYQEAADLCVMPSAMEPFGLVAIEFMSYGKTVIVYSDGGGVVEIVKKSNPDDIVEDNTMLCNRLTYYYNHRQALFSQAAKQKKLAAQFDIKIMEQEFFETYSGILKQTA